MKCIVITAAYPPQVCGVADYTHRLLTAPNATEWKLYHSTNWGITSFFRHIRTINKLHAKHINLQYPAVGYGWSVVPHLLSIYYGIFTKKQFSVTVHEYQKTSTKLRTVFQLILLTADRFIFTNEDDHGAAVKKTSRVASRSCIIGLCSNIPAVDTIRQMNQRTVDIVNFGLIRKYKGIDDYIDVVNILRKEIPNIKAQLIGKPFASQYSYFEHIMCRCKESSIEVILDKSEEEVAELLNNIKIAYLPFHDGASPRRGSMLAAMFNGTVVVSSVGRATTTELSKALLQSTEDKVQVAQSIKETLADNDRLTEKQQDIKFYLEHGINRTWESVVKQYTEFLSK